MQDKLYIVLVGLPARGKSTIATKIRNFLRKDSVKARIFNNGDLRRKIIPNDTSFAEFYDPNNEDATAIREKLSIMNVRRANHYLKKDGMVAILDATNASLARRKLIQSNLDNHTVLHVECINDNRDILDASIRRKIDTPEFSHLDQEKAVKSFKKRISYYENIYDTLKKEKNFIRLDSLNKKVIQEEIKETIPFYDQIRDFLVSDSVKHLYLIRHGETYFNLENRIGGDSSLTQNGLKQAKALGKYFSKKEIPVIFTSSMVRTIETAKPIQAKQKKCAIIPFAEFNEIDSGVCECMSYEEIRNTMPEVYSARKKDKYNYVYPDGEGYITMQERINMGINKALYLSNTSKNIIIVGHRAVNRMILSHFLFRHEEDVPYIYIPQDRFYYISVTQDKKLFELKKY